MKDKKKRGIGLNFALNGLREIFFRERNFRIHILATIVVIIFSFLIGLSPLKWLFILTAITLVLITEALNSVIELILDLLHPEYALEVKVIKDISAAAVLIAAFFAITTASIIFLPEIFRLLF